MVMSVSGSSNNNVPYPLTIKGLILDIDGCIVPSYKMLRAVDEVIESLMRKGCDRDTADKYIHEYIGQGDFQSVLHNEKRHFTQLGRFLEAHPEIKADEFIRQRMGDILHESFKLYDWVKPTVNLAHESGSFVAFYTNTPDFFAVRRLAIAGLDPQKISAVWAKRHPRFAPACWVDRQDATPHHIAFADKLISYDFKKPDATPMETFMALSGAKPHEVIMAGDSANDLRSIHRPEKPPAGIFAMQVQGARDICERASMVNEKLRPGAEPLGADHVLRVIAEIGVGGEVIMLNKGFRTFIELAQKGDLKFDWPDYMPYVKNGKLAVDKPDAASASMRPAINLKLAKG